MIKRIIKGKSGDVIADVFLFLENPTPDKNKFIEHIVKTVQYSEDIGYAGYLNKKGLALFLKFSIYGREYEFSWVDASIEEIMNEIESTLHMCTGFISKRLKIFIFPTINVFVKNKMDGVSGFNPWHNTIILNMFFGSKWKEALRNTIIHELSHVLYLEYNERKTILDNLIFEGIAEHFREHIVGGGQARWVKAIKEGEAKDIIHSIMLSLNTEDDNLYRELFFGTGKYPLWSGYSIGYYILKDYLAKLENLDWNKLMRTKPSEIFKCTKYYRQFPDSSLR